MTNNSRTFPAIVILLIGLVSATINGQKPIRDLKPTVILISLDGFRYDYIDKYRPPEISRLARGGRACQMDDPVIPDENIS